MNFLQMQPLGRKRTCSWQTHREGKENPNLKFLGTLMVSFTPGQMQILINEIDGEGSRAAGTEKGLPESGRKMDDQQQRTWGRSEVTVTLRSNLQLAASATDTARAPTAAPALSLPNRRQPSPALSHGPTPRCVTPLPLHTRFV